MIGIGARFSRKLLCAAVSSACAGAALAGPLAPTVSSGSASYAPATLTLTSTTPRTQVSWQSFNLAANEVFTFVQPNAQSSVLNHVFNPYSMSLLGGLASNGSVLFMTNGVVSGAGVNLDLAGLVNSSLRLPQRALALKSFAQDAPLKALTTLADGRIYVIGNDRQALSSTAGDVVLNPGKTVELAHASTPNLRVELTAPGNEAINISRLVGGNGETGIYAALFRASAAARRAAEGDADTVLTAAVNTDAALTPNMERFLRYALLYAQMRSETWQHEGGMIKAAAAPGRMVLASAKSMPNVLPQAIELGALMPERVRDASGPPLPAPYVAEAVATLEPQPIPIAFESEQERNNATLLALMPVRPVIEMLATLEPQPIAVIGESEQERNSATLLALTPVAPVRELVATLEPQPVLVRRIFEPEEVQSLASLPVARQALTQLAAADAAEVESAQLRNARKAAGPVMVVAALAQPGAAVASHEDASVKEIRIERRAPRFFTDYRGAIFHM